MLYSLSGATQALKSGSFCYGFLILYSYKILVSSLLVCLFVCFAPYGYSSTTWPFNLMVSYPLTTVWVSCQIVFKKLVPVSIGHATDWLLGHVPNLNKSAELLGSVLKNRSCTSWDKCSRLFRRSYVQQRQIIPLTKLGGMGPGKTDLFGLIALGKHLTFRFLFF